jgi:hypothetical protein
MRKDEIENKRLAQEKWRNEHRQEQKEYNRNRRKAFPWIHKFCSIHIHHIFHEFSIFSFLFIDYFLQSKTIILNMKKLFLVFQEKAM